MIRRRNVEILAMGDPTLDLGSSQIQDLDAE
jgi:hypothetical protein